MNTNTVRLCGTFLLCWSLGTGCGDAPNYAVQPTTQTTTKTPETKTQQSDAIKATAHEVVDTSGPCVVMKGNYAVTTADELEALLPPHRGCVVIFGNVRIDGGPYRDLKPLLGLQAVLKTPDRQGGNLSIEFTEGLQNLEGLDELLGVGGELAIRGNTNLKNTKGLESLIEVAGSLRIVANPRLENIDGLKNLLALAAPTIVDNPGLPECRITQLLAQLPKVEETITVAHNGPCDN